MNEKTTIGGDETKASMVLYCLVRKKAAGEEAARFLLIPKNGSPTFPPTKFRPGEDLYHALARPMEQDLGLPASGYFPEEELQAIPNAGESPRYPGLTKQWFLYPVVVSLSDEAAARLDSPDHPVHSVHPETPAGPHLWWTLDEVLQQAAEPNVLAIAAYLRDHRNDLLTTAPTAPSMDALACHWAARHEGGVRIVRSAEIRRILDAGSRAFNLRVADPYLPYQKQGLGFTWSFFTPKDKQDVHVHGLPAVEIYGVLEGQLQLWHKSMNQRGVRTWRCQTLAAGDWAEVEPLHCHFACWLDPQGLGTVVKAAATGELAGVGKLGVAGKTTCEKCNVQKQCQIPPAMQELFAEYQKAHNERDWGRIRNLAEGADAPCPSGVG